MSPSVWKSLGLLALGARASLASEELVGRHGHRVQQQANGTTVYDPACTANVTLYDTTTVIVDKTVDVTHVLDVYVNSTTTNIVAAYVTEYTTETLHFTESTTTTLHYTVNVTETETETDSTTLTNSTTVTTTGTAATTVTTTGVTGVTVTTTGTVPTTVTTTGTTGVTVTTTGTDSTTITTSTTTTTTLFSTTFEPCPKSCSISADTVNLFYWPTNRPYTYPSTYVDPTMNYTFTSPSVYMYIPTARGINTAGQPAGPSTSHWILALDLYEVSTIANGTGSTSQLNLADLGTNCPRTADPTAIATMVDAACDPVLAAPRQVSSWAYPCNACGRFGLFDPPYAVPTVTGPLVTPVVSTVVPPPVTITQAPTPAPTSAPPPVGVLLVVYYSDGTPVATATVTQVGISGTVVSSVNVPATSTAAASATGSGAPAPASSTAAAQTSAIQSSAAAASGSATTTSPVVVGGNFSSSATGPSVVATAAAPKKATYGIEWLAAGVVMAAFLL